MIFAVIYKSVSLQLPINYSLIKQLKHNNLIGLNVRFHVVYNEVIKQEFINSKKFNLQLTFAKFKQARGPWLLLHNFLFLYWQNGRKIHGDIVQVY